MVGMDTKGEKLSTISIVGCMLMLPMILSEVALPSLACASDTSDCSKCIVTRFKFNCPGCMSIMRCLAKCLWGGASRTKCIKKCDCNSDYPRPADCKKCLSQCKCSCSSQLQLRIWQPILLSPDTYIFCSAVVCFAQNCFRVNVPFCQLVGMVDPLQCFYNFPCSIKVVLNKNLMSTNTCNNRRRKEQHGQRIDKAMRFPLTELINSCRVIYHQFVMFFRKSYILMALA